MSDRPTSNDDSEAWKAYWTAQAMLWRTEPEINEERQRYLATRRAVQPDIERGIYPFRDESGSIKLTRADVEWLLATHESGGMRGPVDWDDMFQRKRIGLDMRGADLSELDLHALPLARLRAGLAGDEWRRASVSQRVQAGVWLAHSKLSYTRLEGAILTYGHLEGADIRECHLEGAELTFGHLEADIPANMRLLFFDQATRLDGLILANKRHVGPRIVDVHWNDANLAIIDWASVQMLDDEQRARQKLDSDGAPKRRLIRLQDTITAVRANRQLATLLRSQGLNEDADRFAYRAQLCQRVVLRRQHHYLRYLGSMFLWLIAGYGYNPLRSFLTYIIMVLGFAAAFFFLAPLTGVKFEPLGALVFSVTSFHGRGFSPGETVSLTNLVTVLAAGEAIIGLLIEITFIATFTQRFFAR